MKTNEEILLEIYEKLQRLLSSNEEINKILTSYDENN
jgi:hypothetical protein